jgi:hypothetical protein
VQSCKRSCLVEMHTAPALTDVPWGETGPATLPPLNRGEEEAMQLHNDVSRTVSSLQQTLKAEETKYKVRCSSGAFQPPAALLLYPG